MILTKMNFSEIKECLNFNKHKCYRVHEFTYGPDKKQCQIVYDKYKSESISHKTMILTMDVSEFEDWVKLYERNRKINKIISTYAKS